jgi:rhamnosyltransferase
MPDAIARVWAVVVAFHPDGEVLAALLRELRQQTEAVVVVDNSEPGTPAPRFPEDGAIVWRRLGANRGVAAALNVGIAIAGAAGATHVLLSDQDSLPAPGMVAGLLDALQRLQRDGERVAAVGPRYIDLHSGGVRAFKAVPRGPFSAREVMADAQRPDVPALTLITSGTLIPVEALAAVGPMLEELFIDRVDTEWCLRARARGWSLFGTARATLYQRMGDGPLRVWYWGWRRINVYAPVRIYYQVRNTVFLLGKDVGPTQTLRQLWFALGLVYAHALFGTRRRACLAMALRGVRDGLLRRMGPYRG